MDQWRRRVAGFSVMAEKTEIAWTDATFNPWVGCTKISPGCDFCYAEGWAKRSGLVKWGEARRRTSAANWRQPLKWEREAAATGRRRRVFCASLADVFDNEVPSEWRDDLWELIESTPHLDWLLLTKRIGNVKTMVPWYRGPDWPRNIWLGASIVNQDEADRDITKLLLTPARIRFLSMEPLLEPVDLSPYLRSKISWCIVGGESGHHSRPMEIEWARSLKTQCADAGVAFFMKQGSQANWPRFKDFESFPPELKVRQWPK
jgi:protein gp37